MADGTCFAIRVQAAGVFGKLLYFSDSSPGDVYPKSRKKPMEPEAPLQPSFLDPEKYDLVKEILKDSSNWH